MLYGLANDHQWALHNLWQTLLNNNIICTRHTTRGGILLPQPIVAVLGVSEWLGWPNSLLRTFCEWRISEERCNLSSPLPRLAPTHTPTCPLQCCCPSHVDVSQRKRKAGVLLFVLIPLYLVLNMAMPGGVLHLFKPSWRHALACLWHSDIQWFRDGEGISLVGMSIHEFYGTTFLHYY